MKICGIICEYNPFHNGHAYLLSEAKKQSGADALLCIMSGNFTQRGEMAGLDKFTRAKHAVLAGADAVIELPAVFAISPAEIFAKGAVKLLASCPSFDTLAFGCEDGDRISFLQTAKATADESRELKAAIRANLKAGMSLTKARHEAIAAAHACDKSAAIGISHSGASKDIVSALRLAKENGAVTIALTHLGKSPIGKVSDIILSTVSDETNYRILGLSSRIAQLTIVDAIYSYLVCHMPDAARSIAVTEDALRDKKI